MEVVSLPFTEFMNTVELFHGIRYEANAVMEEANRFIRKSTLPQSMLRFGGHVTHRPLHWPASRPFTFCQRAHCWWAPSFFTFTTSNIPRYCCSFVPLLVVPPQSTTEVSGRQPIKPTPPGDPAPDLKVMRVSYVLNHGTVGPKHNGIQNKGH
ncbi:hypothetical protein CSUB01_12687 [Colletotrichum sublineola]|uniref:Uncharacterized protein n=1 Tax=Colletotrichum sublineola TaxID=1173701 RepID=A0A066Y0W0_COLSU|nr:hypothetical protein CSUB01_12687 [Colletotrichum sublineola]